MAHTWQPLTFEDPKILGHIKALNYSSLDERFPETPLEKVRSASSTLLTELTSAANQIGIKGYRVRQTGGRLIAGFGGDIDNQLGTVRSLLANIENNLSTSSGEKRAFFRAMLKRLGTRFLFVEQGVPADRKAEVATLRSTLQSMIAKEGGN